MRTPAVVVTLAIVFGSTACGGDDPSLAAWCGLVADGAVVPLDAADAPEAWAGLERTAPDEVRVDVERLRVAAQQVAELEPGDVTSASVLVLVPEVLDAHRRVVSVIGSRCRIDVSDLSVIDVR